MPNSHPFRMIAWARAALAIGIAFMSAAAAHALTVPHTFNTPYLLQGPNGQCAQIYGTTPDTPPWGVERATCDPSQKMQKFYLLQVKNDDDAVLPSNSVNPPPPSPALVTQARIVFAQTFDGSDIAAGYWLLTLCPYCNPTNTDYAPLYLYAYYNGWEPPGDTAIFNLTQPSSPQAAWTTIASEGQAFPLVGRRTVRYGANDKWVVKNVDGSNVSNAQGTCNVAFFGSDPNAGVPQHCDIYDDPAAGGPYRLVIYDNHFFWCINTDIVFPWEWSGRACGNPPPAWTLIPVDTYPH